MGAGADCAQRRFWILRKSWHPIGIYLWSLQALTMRDLVLSGRRAVHENSPGEALAVDLSPAQHLGQGPESHSLLECPAALSYATVFTFECLLCAMNPSPPYMDETTAFDLLVENKKNQHINRKFVLVC